MSWHSRGVIRWEKGFPYKLALFFFLTERERGERRERERERTIRGGAERGRDREFKVGSALRVGLRA